MANPIEVLWLCDPGAAVAPVAPATAAAAMEILSAGNVAFAELLTRAEAGLPTARRVMHLAAKDLGLNTAGDEAPAQLPFAAVLGCADARVPVEMILAQQANDLFVVRVAGNVAGSLSMGSLDYAVGHLPSLRLLAVLGHTACGAVTAAVDAFLAPVTYMGITADLPLRAIVDSIMTAVCGAAHALRLVHGDEVRDRRGYRAALIELTVILNAAVTAAALRQSFQAKSGPTLGVAYGVFNLHNHLVGLPGEPDGTSTWQPGLREAPSAELELGQLALQMAKSEYIVQHLV